MYFPCPSPESVTFPRPLFPLSGAWYVDTKSGHCCAHGYCFHAYTHICNHFYICLKEHVFKNPCDQANASNLNPRPQGSSQPFLSRVSISVRSLTPLICTTFKALVYLPVNLPPKHSGAAPASLSEVPSAGYPSGSLSCILRCQHLLTRE